MFLPIWNRFGVILSYSCLLRKNGLAGLFYFRYCKIHGKQVFQGLEGFVPWMAGTGLQLVVKRESNGYRNIYTSRYFKGNLKFCDIFLKQKVLEVHFLTGNLVNVSMILIFKYTFKGLSILFTLKEFCKLGLHTMTALWSRQKYSV